MKRESLLHQHLRAKVLRVRPAAVYWRFSDRLRPGYPDTYILFDDKYAWIELKALDRWKKGYNLSALQRQCLRHLSDQGGRAFLLVKCGADYLLLSGEHVDTELSHEEIVQSLAIYFGRDLSELLSRVFEVKF